MEHMNNVIPPSPLHGVTNCALKVLEGLMKTLMHGSLSKFLDDMLQFYNLYFGDIMGCSNPN